MSEKIYYTIENVEDEEPNLKDKIKFKFQDVKEWITNNKQLVIALVPVIAGCSTTIIKVVGKRRNLNKQESIKNLYCYDRSLGHYWRLKRELTNKEWVEIDKRKNNGERLADILSELKVLK